MTKKMVNAAILVAVLAVAVMAPSTTFAAGHGSPAVSVASHGPSLLDMFMSLFGFNHGPKSRPDPTPWADTATWGGNKCPLCH